MENMLSNSWENNNNNKLEFDEVCIKHFSETRKWTMFLSILGFIFTGLSILGFIVMLAFAPAMGNKVLLSFIPLLLIVTLYFFPLYYLIRFSIYSKRALKTMDQSTLTTSFKYLNYFYRFIGIMTIAIIGLYLVCIVVVAISAAFMKH